MVLIMDKTEIRIQKNPDLESPVLIEGLPGLGLVGKLASEHLISELDAKKFGELYSPDFPPQVVIQPDSTVRMRKNEFYYWNADKKGQKDLIIVVGDDQGLTVQSQYKICDMILDQAEEYKTNMVYTLGGYGMQKLSKTPRVFGAVTHKDMVEEFKKHGVIFEGVGGHIVGVAGLLIGLGQLRGMRGICLMGETHGNYVDARAAKNVLKVVSSSLSLDIGYDDLDKKAKEIEDMILSLEKIRKKSLKEIPKQYSVPERDEGPLSYIR